ncbi:MAG: SPOR domain-containing protein [Paracoccaceae bacterium]
MGSAVAAQSLSQVNGPAETPPSSYSGNEYVDTAGCAFVRANVGGKVTWLQRLDKDRKPVCGLAPTVAAGPAVPSDTVAAEQNAASKPETVEKPAPVASASPAAEAPAAMPSTATKATTRTTRKQVKRRAVRAATEPGTRLVEDHLVIGYDTHCEAQLEWARRYLLSDGRRVVTCDDDRPDAPVAYINGLGAPGLVVEDRPAGDAEAARAKAQDKSATYQVVWQKGKLRGQTSAPSKAVKTAPARVPATAAVTPAARFVQVGAFGDPANVERAVARLKAMGLPVAILRKKKIGDGLQKVLAGPFDNPSDLNAALSLVRRNGYADAYPRR